MTYPSLLDQSLKGVFLSANIGEVFRFLETVIV